MPIYTYPYTYISISIYIELPISNIINLTIYLSIIYLTSNGRRIAEIRAL